MAVATRHSVEGVQRGIRDIATRCSGERADRQQRRELHASDFAEIAETGFLELVVPAEAGGLWAATATSTRAVCEVLRELARADVEIPPPRLIGRAGQLDASDRRISLLAFGP